MTLHISGITRQDFEKRFAEAVAAITGSPVRKVSRIRRGMTVLCHGGTGPGQNEHTLDQFFSSTSEGASVDKAMVIKLKKYDYQDSKVRLLQDIHTFVCKTEATLERVLADILRTTLPSNTPDNIDLHRSLAITPPSSEDDKKRLLQSSFLKAHVKMLYAQSLREHRHLISPATDNPITGAYIPEAFEDTLKDMSLHDLVEWLIETADIKHMMVESGLFSVDIWRGWREVAVEEVSMTDEGIAEKAEEIEVAQIMGERHRGVLLETLVDNNPRPAAMQSRTPEADADRDVQPKERRDDKRPVGIGVLRCES